MTYYNEIIEILNELKNEEKITSIQFSIIKTRFISELINYNTKLNRYTRFYNFFRFNVTFGSLIVPALLSIQNNSNQTVADITYWSTWTISLLVTTCNGLIGLFSLDKNYIMYGLTLEKMKSEGWQFLQLSGKYVNLDTHDEAFPIFCKNIEDLKIKQIQLEYSEGKSKPGNKMNNKPVEKKQTDNNMSVISNPNINNLLNGLMNMSSSTGINQFQNTAQTVAQNTAQTVAQTVAQNKLNEVLSNVRNTLNPKILSDASLNDTSSDIELP